MNTEARNAIHIIQETLRTMRKDIQELQVRILRLESNESMNQEFTLEDV